MKDIIFKIWEGQWNQNRLGRQDVLFGASNRDIEVKFYKELVTLLAVEKGLVKNVPHDSRDLIFVKETVVTARAQICFYFKKTSGCMEVSLGGCKHEL